MLCGWRQAIYVGLLQVALNSVELSGKWTMGSLTGSSIQTCQHLPHCLSEGPIATAILRG